MSYKILALATCLILPLGGTAFAQTGSPGAGPSAGGTVNSGSGAGTAGSTGGTMSGSGLSLYK
ncbi:hypothetical protein [Methylobacterium sp. WL6]|uniref:hypothetical protein n=1 Tax=Methylobacterium sp. WL6 TaxID=2603901 RepID=UPI0011CBCBF6|nr:hypothetical protein [Methylobacterium sp. WL6]